MIDRKSKGLFFSNFAVCNEQKYILGYFFSFELNN